MALYIGDKKYAVTKALYRGFYMVVVHGFAGTTVTCAGTTLYIGSNESVIFKIIDPGTYTFVATRKGETKTETLVLNPETSQYSYNIGMYIGMQKIEYLEADTTQYIDTGIVPHAGYSVEMEFQFISLTPPEEADVNTQICGVRQLDDPNRFYPIAVATGPTLRSSYGTSQVVYNASENLLKHKVEFNKNGHIYLDGVDKGATSGYVEPENPQYTMFLFKWNYGPSGPSDPVCKMRIFSYKMWDNNGNLLQDLVPVLDNTLQGCMYDKISQQMYYNAGEGNFITGPSMVYDELVYIETDPLYERQWIDSEYIPNNKSAIEYNVQLLEVPNGRYVFGNYDTDSQYYLYTNNGTSKWEFGWSSIYTTSSNNRDTNFHSFYLYIDNGTSYLKCDGNIVSNAPTTSQIETHTLPLLSGRNNGTSTEVGLTLHQKFFGCKIWDDGTLVRDLIPVKRKTGEVCMWDKVEEKFYYNKGTGNFIDGPVKSYTELEYLESSGTQWIDTGFAPTLNTEVDIVAQYLSINNSDYDTIIGHSGSSNTNRFYPFSSIRGNNVLRSSWGSEQNYTFPFDTNVHSIKYNTTNAHKIIRDGVEIVTLPTGSYTPNGRSLYLFICNTQNELVNPAWPATARVYECQIYDNETLVRDFVPAKRSDNVLGMLDKVNNKFYTNIGTGEFIAGPERGEYIELEYLSCNGNQYINTGIKFTGNTSEIDAKHKINSSLSDSYSSLSATQDSADNARWASIQYQKSNNKYTFVIGNLPASSGILKTPSGNADHVIYSSEGTNLTVTYNDEVSTLASGGSAWNDQYLYIGCKNTNGSLGEYYCGDIYNYKLKINNVLVLDLIPVRRWSDMKTCFYDKVNEVYYVSEGSSDFIAGPVKSN